MTKTLLVDGNNLLARSDFATKNKGVEMSVGSVNTAALHVFIQLLAKYVKQVSPTHMAVFWDAGHDFRDALYPPYKANRKKSEGPEGGDSMPFALAKEFLTWAGVPHKAHRGYEADDLIAATARQSKGKVVILSGDKDLLQLVGWQGFPEPDRHRDVVQIRVPDDDEWDEEAVEAKFGVPPHHLAHYLAMVGDTSDNVPGVAGIGPKKALALLEKAGWDWAAALDLMGSEKAAQARLMIQLVDLRSYPYDEIFMASNSGAPEFRPTVLGDGSHVGENLKTFCTLYRLETTRQRLESGTLWAESVSMADVFADADSPVDGP
jgi:5'-3' exonuclease